MMKKTMKFSEMDDKRLPFLSVEQKTKIVLAAETPDSQADVAILLGGHPANIEERVPTAATLYHSGKVLYILVSGGVEWVAQGERISEAQYMKKLLLAEGVPEEAIILENEARTTKENMLYAAIQLGRRFRLENVHCVCVVTSSWHLKRSMALAKWLLPRTIEVTGYPTQPMEQFRQSWMKNEWFSNYVDRELPLLKKLILQGVLEDVEV